jgi:CheY-like chemotaxis protein
LTRHGYRVVETATVEQTLAAAHDGVQAILLDTSLDGMNGWEILPLLRRLDPEAAHPSFCSASRSRQGPTDLPPGRRGMGNQAAQ